MLTFQSEGRRASVEACLRVLIKSDAELLLHLLSCVLRTGLAYCHTGLLFEMNYHLIFLIFTLFRFALSSFCEALAPNRDSQQAG